MERLDAPPPELIDTFDHDKSEIEEESGVTALMFYGALSKDILLPSYLDGRQSIVGMSGGPILGFARMSEGFKYWVVALQSTWHPTTRTIMGCPIPLIAMGIKSWVRSLER